MTVLLKGLRFTEDILVEKIHIQAPSSNQKKWNPRQPKKCWKNWRTVQGGRWHPSSGVELGVYRQQKAKPLGDQFSEWNREQLWRLDLVPGNPLSKAPRCIHQQEKELQVYLNDPKVAIDTNHLECGLLCIPMERKNWIFSWTEKGADRPLPKNGN